MLSHPPHSAESVAFADTIDNVSRKWQGVWKSEDPGRRCGTGSVTRKLELNSACSAWPAAPPHIIVPPQVHVCVANVCGATRVSSCRGLARWSWAPQGCSRNVGLGVRALFTPRPGSVARSILLHFATPRIHSLRTCPTYSYIQDVSSESEHPDVQGLHCT